MALRTLNYKIQYEVEGWEQSETELQTITYETGEGLTLEDRINELLEEFKQEIAEEFGDDFNGFEYVEFVIQTNTNTGKVF